MEPEITTQEKVEVNKSALEKLIAKVDAQEKEIKKLTEISDKGRLAHWESTHKSSLPKNYMVSMYGEKVITSWQMTQNRVWKNPRGEWQEAQEIELTLEDGEVVKLPYIEFVSNTRKEQAKLSSTKQEGGKTYLTVELQDGKRVTLDSLFIN